jgi:hypothetical protein
LHQIHILAAHLFAFIHHCENHLVSHSPPMALDPKPDLYPEALSAAVILCPGDTIRTCGLIVPNDAL